MPQFWQVTINGVPLKKALTKAEADAIAERWQGSHSGNRGLLKHKDRGDWVEVKRDHQTEREWDESYEVLKQGNPQRYVVTGGGA